MNKINPYSLLLLAVLAWPLNANAVAPPEGRQTLLTLPHVPGQFLVKRAPGVPVEAISEILDCVTGVVLDTSEVAGLDVVAIDDDAHLEEAFLLLNLDARIASAEPNYISQLLASPNDLEYSEQWAKDNNGINSPSGIGHPGADLNLEAAWDTQSVAPEVILAVIDDSIDTSHVDLVANTMSTGRCFASPNSMRPCANGPNDPNPVDAGDYHGTWVAGIAGATGNNGIGIAGTAWDVKLLPLKVDLSHFAIVEAIDEAINQGADIINASFGGPVQGSALSDAISRAEQAGILFVAAAGNADANNAIATNYPANATQSNVISVAASTSRDRIAPFSQWSSTAVHLAAPGNQVKTTSDNNSFTTVNGTSFAAPHVAGVAALIKANSGASDYRQLKAFLLNGGTEGRDALGPATPGLDKRGISGRVAAGRLDAAKALNGPDGAVLIIDRVFINDTNTGNSNNRLDPGETALLEITLSNVWTAESNVTGVLTAQDNSSLSVNEVAPVLFGDVNQDGVVTAGFNVTLSPEVIGNEHYFLQLDLNAATPLASRYFYLEVGTLTNNVSISQDIQRFNWDEFQAFNFDVPAGATDLSVTTSGPGDIDLLLRHNRSPEYLIALGTGTNGNSYYVDEKSYLSAESGADESIVISNPLPGTWHAVVVNFDQQIKNYDIVARYTLPSSGQIAFSNSSYSVSELDGTISITVARSGGVAGASVEFATEDQTAISGADYSGVSGKLTWGLGDNWSKVITIPIVNDTDPELAESFLVRLFNAEGSTLASPDTTNVTIIDDDSGSGSLLFSESDYSVSESVGSAVVTVRRVGGSIGEASVSFATLAGQAGAGSDFVNTDGLLSWAHGEGGDKSFTVTIVDDSNQEAQESFSVQLSDPQGAVLGSQSLSTIRISDNDVSSPSSSSSGGGGGGSLNLLLLGILAALGYGRRRLLK